MPSFGEYIDDIERNFVVGWQQGSAIGNSLLGVVGQAAQAAGQIKAGLSGQERAQAAVTQQTVEAQLAAAQTFPLSVVDAVPPGGSIESGPAGSAKDWLGLAAVALLFFVILKN